MDEDGVDDADEEPGLFECVCDGPPVHPGMFHDDSDVASDLSQTLHQLIQFLSSVADLDGRQDDLSTGLRTATIILPLDTSMPTAVIISCVI